MAIALSNRLKSFVFAAFFILPLFLFSSTSAFATFEHEHISRIVVFPFEAETESKDKDLQNAAVNSWWSVREKLTETKRFLVASRDFMKAKEVFQPRGKLLPADAIILGRLLEADALVTVFLKEHVLNMRVYETTNGLTLWSGKIALSPALPMSRQFGSAADKLLYQFIASIPYQGYVIVDPLIGHATYVENDNLMAKARIGANSQISKGDDVQLIRVGAIGLKPVFQSGLNIQVYAEGVVTKVDKQVITIQIDRRQTGAKIKEGALVRVPAEFERLQKAYGLQPDLTKNLAVELYQLNDNEPTEAQKRRQPLITSLAFIGNLAFVLLIAF